MGRNSKNARYWHKGFVFHLFNQIYIYIFNLVVMYIRCSCSCALLLAIFGTLPSRHESYVI